MEDVNPSERIRPRYEGQIAILDLGLRTGTPQSSSAQVRNVT